MRRKVLALASAGALCALYGFVAAGCNNATDGMEVFESVLSPSNEVPARGTAANGRAQYVSDGTTVHYTIEVDDILNITAAHIHSAASGVNGPIRVFFYGNGSPNPGPAITFTDRGILVEGSFTAANVTGISFSDLLNQMRTGQCYTNVHTQVFPGGEMRGQVQQVSVN